MKKNLLLICSLIAILTYSCKKDEDPVVPPPLASFTIANDSCDAPCGVTFTSTSQNATNYAWDFGDGNTSTLPNPRHIYTSPGDYNVKLQASNSVGSDIVSDSVNIKPTVYHFHYKVNSQLVSPSAFQAQREITPGVLSITANNFGFSLVIPSGGLTNGQNIIFNSQSSGVHNVYWNGFGGVSYYSSDIDPTGIILKIDYVNYVSGGIISGTFSGSLTSASGVPVPVTDGSFKVQFSN
ncbi:MAG: PKD domain-containing protein [Bacteroidia bacterium]